MNEEMSVLKQDIYWIVENSLSYPSGDNTQPFSFLYTKQNSLKIYCKKTDDDGPFGAVAYYIALGCFLEILSLRAQQKHYSVEIDIPDSFYERVLAVQIHFKNNAEKYSAISEALYKAIDKRHTDRRRYLKNNIENEITKILTEETEQMQLKKMQINYVNNLSDGLIAQLCKLERKIWSIFYFVRPILQAINYRILSPKKSTGLNLRNVGVHPILAFLGYFESKLQWVFKLNVLLGRPWLNQFIIKNQILNSGGFGLLSINDQTQRGIIDASRLFCRVWIKICGQGYSMQPLSVATLLPFSLKRQKHADKWVDSKLSSYLQQIELILKNEFRVSSDAGLLWMFRVGVPKGFLTKSAMTGRKTISEVWAEE